jgi:predicted Zn-dependent protease with MMP-like domain
MDWTNIEAPSLDELERLARTEYAVLPAHFRDLCGDILFIVQEFPDEEVMRDLDLDSEFDVLGLFQGATLAERTSNAGRPEPTAIFLYRRPILDYWAEDHGTLGAIVRHVIVHEVGHHFGLSDADMEKIEKEI